MYWKQSKEELDNFVKQESERLEKLEKESKEHPEKDPDAKELNDLMLNVAFIGANGRMFEETPYGYLQDSAYKNLRQKFYSFMAEETLKFIDEEHQLEANELYEYFQESLRSMATLGTLAIIDSDTETDSVDRGFLNQLCDVASYCKKRVRDYKNYSGVLESNLGMGDEYIYNNESEFSTLMEKYLNSHLATTRLTSTYYVQNIEEKNSYPQANHSFKDYEKRIFDLLCAINNSYGHQFKELSQGNQSHSTK